MSEPLHPGSRLRNPLGTAPSLLAAIILTTAFPAAGAPGTPGAHPAIDESRLPPAVSHPVDYLRDIKPILEASCLKCHGPEKPKSRFRVDDRAALLRGGENGVSVIPGQSGRSPLIHYVARLVPDLEMPPNGKGEPLTAGQVSLLRAWIDQELPWGGETNATYSSLEVDPTLRWMSVSGDAKKFREHYWFPEGWNGGAEHFELREQLDAEWRLGITGHALRDDYKVALTLDRNNGVFLRSGFERYRKYYDDSGGYYAPFTAPLLSLGRDLHLDLGRAWVEAGGITPFGLQFTGGYEYQFKEGDKSLTQWRPAGPLGAPKNIMPNAKAVDERLHILRLDAGYDWRALRFTDNFRYEFYDLDTTRSIVAAGFPSASFRQSMQENDTLQNVANAFQTEAHPREWLLVSAGHLYSRSSGDNGFRMRSGAPGGPAVLYRGQGINLDRSAHVFNANAQADLWEGMTFSSGLQTEWNRQHTLGIVHLDEIPDPFTPFTANTNLVRGDHDRFIAEERFVLRNTQVPFTVLYAEARFRQEQVQQFEELTPAGAGSPTLADFRRDADVDYDRKQYRAGFTTSPWTRAALSAHVQRRDQEDDFHDNLDNRPPSTPGSGYPGFITRREVTADELGAKLVLRPASWVKATLSYKRLSTDYATTTDATPTAPVGDRSPGGRITGGRYDADIYSLNGTFTPWRRLYLSSTFSLQDSRITTADHGSAAIAPYRGHVYSALTSANYLLTEQTDANIAYDFSYADYGQNNVAAGLPLGLTYHQHGLHAGLGHRFLKRFTANLQYVWALYDESTSGHLNDYTAHGCFATVRMNWN